MSSRFKLGTDPEYTMKEEYIKDIFDSIGIKMTKPSVKFVSMIMAHLHLLDGLGDKSSLGVSINNTLGYSPEGIRKLLNYLEYHDYIKVDRGHLSKRGSAAPKKVRSLVNTLDKYKTLPHLDKDIGQYSDRRIILSTPDGRLKPDLSTMPDYVRYRNRVLNTYSDLLEGYDIKLNNIKIGSSFIRSIYSGDFESHGRIYAPWQLIPSKDRDNILIDGAITGELDFSGMGINIVYNLHGRDLNKDAYGFKSGLSRSDNKVILNILLNTSSKKSAYLAIKSKFPYYKDISKLLESIELYHFKISQSFYNSIGMRVMNLDGKVCEQVIEGMIKEDLPVLSIHDGFLSKTEDLDKLKEIMEESYECILEHKSPIIH